MIQKYEEASESPFEQSPFEQSWIASSVRSFFQFENLMTGILLLGSALSFGYFLSNEWESVLSYLWVPLWAIGLVFSRSAVFSALLPLSVLGALAGIRYVSPPTFVAGPQRYLLALSGITTIVLAARYSALCMPAAERIASQRLNYTPTYITMKPESRTSRSRIDLSWLFTLGFLVIAWSVASYMSSQLSAFLRNYETVRIILDRRIGLLPEWYVGFIVLFVLGGVLWLAQQFFGYLVLRQRDGSVAAMHLRSELWRWDGSEQRRIGRELGRKDTTKE